MVTDAIAWAWPAHAVSPRLKERRRRSPAPTDGQQRTFVAVRRPEHVASTRDVDLPLDPDMVALDGFHGGSEKQSGPRSMR